LPLVGYIFRDCGYENKVRPNCEKLICRIIARGKALGLDMKELAIAYQFLAESYVYEGFPTTCGSDAVAAIIDRHLRDLNWLSDSATLADLRFPYAVARGHLIHGRVTEALSLLKKLFTHREKIADETHLRSNHFIAPLLESFCQDLNGSTERDKLWGILDSAFIDDILRFCLATDRYVEVDTLVQECRYHINETRADSSNDRFWIFDQLIITAQSDLAKHGTPPGAYYWEDNRMYCRTWKTVTMKRAFPADPMSAIPVPVIVHRAGIIFEDAGSATLLQNSAIIRLLDAKRRANDWRILSAYDQQNWRGTSKHFAGTAGPHRFWIFPEDLMEYEGGPLTVSNRCKCSEDHH
jgi:hypothetical protein